MFANIKKTKERYKELLKVIDISYYNGGINFTRVAKEVNGVIIRAGYRGYSSGKLVTDNMF